MEFLFALFIAMLIGYLLVRMANRNPRERERRWDDEDDFFQL